MNKFWGFPKSSQEHQPNRLMLLATGKLEYYQIRVIIYIVDVFPWHMRNNAQLSALEKPADRNTRRC